MNEIYKRKQNIFIIGYFLPAERLADKGEEARPRTGRSFIPSLEITFGTNGPFTRNKPTLIFCKYDIK